MILADLWADSRKQRQAEINSLKQQVRQWKKQTKAEQNLVREELNIQAQETRQSLSDFIADLQQQGDLDRQQRQQDREERQNQNSDRHLEVAELIEEFAQKRENYRVEFSTNARILNQELQDFHQNLQSSVWGITTNLATPSPQKSHPTKAKASAPKESKQPEKSAAKAPSPKPQTREDKIYQLVKESEGISLTEIEQKFDLERKVTIELIRKLIQEGKLEQRDRLYFVTS